MIALQKKFLLTQFLTIQLRELQEERRASHLLLIALPLTVAEFVPALAVLID